MTPDLLMLGFAGASTVAGLFAILFPQTIRKWSDARQEFKIHQAPESLRLKSNASIRALGVGLLLVAGLLAYYGLTVKWPALP